jgi:hypothetical protein
MVAFGTGDYFLKYIDLKSKKFMGKKNILEPTVNRPFVWFLSRLHFLLVWRVFLTQYKAQSPGPSNMSGRFSRGLVLFSLFSILNIFDMS